MCLYVKSKAEVRTANKPILVWKFVKENEHAPDVWISPYYSYVDFRGNKYGELVIAKKIVRVDELQPLEDFEFEPVYHDKYRNLWAWFRCDPSYLDCVENPKEKVIQEGLHAYRSKYRTNMRRIVKSIVHPAIIPVGAKYVKGKYREIVSTQMIVCKTLEDAKRIMNEQKRRINNEYTSRTNQSRD